MPPWPSRVPISEHTKLIWEAHYIRVAGHFGVDNCGRSSEIFLLDKTSTGRHQIY
jgi:hypothetical protein